MKDFLTVFRVLYRNRYAVEKEVNTGKRKLPQSTVVILSMLPLVVFICVILGFAAANLTTRYSAMTLLNAILSAVQIFVLFMTLPSVLGTLYTSSDGAFLSSLPVSPSAVFFAKLLLVYVGTLKTSAVLLLPSMLTVSITYAAFGNPMFHGFYPLVLLIVLVAPLLPMFLVVLFSMPLVWIGSYLKGRSVLKTVFTLVFYVLLMVAYMALVAYFNTTGFANSGEGLSDNALAALSLLSEIMYPNRALLSMCLGIDAAKNFGISLAIWAGLFFLTVLLAKLFYRKISVRQAEAHREENKAGFPFRRSKPIFALIKRDFLSLVRNPSMAMATFSNTILAPVVMAVMYFFTRGETSQTESALAAEMMTGGIVLLYALVFLCGTNMVAMTAYSREGESFFISKFLPVAPKTSVTSKLVFSMLVAVVTLVVMLILGIALYGIGPATAAGIAASAVLFCAGTSSLHIYYDIKKGNVHWKSQSDMRSNMNGNFSTLVPVLLCVAPAVLFIVAGVFLAELEDNIGALGVKALYWCFILIVSVAVAAAGLYILYDKGVPLFERIGENRALQKHGTKGERSLFGGGKDNFLR